jgi:hypothetical protein
LIQFKLGVNYFDSEEFHDAEKFLTEALEGFNSLPKQIQEEQTNFQ